MAGLRPLLLTHRWFAAWLIVLALALRLVVPAGYMIGAAHGAPTIELCPGTAPTVAMPGMAHHQHGKANGKDAMPCAFAATAAPSLAGADPVLLAAVVALPAAAPLPVARRAAPGATPLHLRPPLRGPPGQA